MSVTKANYEVGKGKPPKSTRFKPGQSGNPKGRPRGKKNLSTEIEEVLTKSVTISENGRKRKVTSRQAAIMQLCKKALAGDNRALDRFLSLAQTHEADRAAAGAERNLNSAEEDILERYVAVQLGQGMEGIGKPADTKEGDDEYTR